MATRSKAAPVDPFAPEDDEQAATAIPGTGGLVGYLADEDESPAERIARQAREMASDQGAIVKLYRIQAGTRKMEWCEDFSPEEYESGGDAMIRNKWGAGAYHVRIYGDVPNPRTNGTLRSCLGRADITIAAPRVQELAPNQNSDLTQVLQLLAQQNARIMEAITNRPPVDPSQQMRETLGLMTLMREAMGLNNQQQTQKSSIAEVIDAVREMRGVASELLPPPADAEVSPMTLLPKVLEVVQAGLLSKAQQPQMQPIQSQQLAPPLQPIHVPQTLASPPVEQAAQPQPQQLPEHQTTDEPMNELQQLRATSLAELVALAESGADPVKGAELIYEKIPDEMIELLASTWWFMQLAFVAPEVKPHQEWFTKARNQALAMFNDDATEDTSLAGTGDPTHPG